MYIYLLQQNFCHDKKYFVMTNIILLQQKFCCGKHTSVRTKDVFVATKIILAAAPANDRVQDWFCRRWAAARAMFMFYINMGGGGGGGGEWSHKTVCP